MTNYRAPSRANLIKAKRFAKHAYKHCPVGHKKAADVTNNVMSLNIKGNSIEGKAQNGLSVAPRSKNWLFLEMILWPDKADDDASHPAENSRQCPDKSN